MPRKSAQSNEESENELIPLPNTQQNQGEVEDLTRMLAAVLEYLSDDSNEEIDVGYLFDSTQGLREWWTQYQENNRKKIEDEIAASLGELTLEDLNKIRDQVKGKK
ncbi:hypothetical protein [Ureibacillus sp. FSL E2-3493]|uniref:hypothetical protein n=1 Tax=Ureibacillus sp. FSL E2-3493 TaxID=2921367 RepID=UPI003119E038